MIANQVDCIVRFHNPERLYELQRCIFSLVGQRHRPLHIIVVAQRFTPQALAVTRATIERLMGLSSGLTLTLLNWEEAFPIDARTELLNFGLRSVTGEFVAFLDYDDVIYPEAYELLAKRLRSTQSAIAFAGVRVVQAEVFPSFLHLAAAHTAPFAGENLMDLFNANFCPIHSYLIDRSKLDPDILHFDSQMTWEEDYDLLLKICAAYPSDFEAVKAVIGDYYFKNDGSNSVPTDGRLSEQRKLEYERVQAYIEVRRRTTLVSPRVQEKLGIVPPLPTLTIRGLLNRGTVRTTGVQ